MDKKQILEQKSGEHKSVVNEILDNPDIRDQFILKLTYHSNSIEGSTLTEPDTAAILFDDVALPNKSLTEQLEAKNYQTALNYLFDHIALYERAKIDDRDYGRVGRLLMNAMLLNANFAPAIIRQEQKRLYYTYLYKAQTEDDHSQLEDFLCDAIMDGFKILDRTDER